MSERSVIVRIKAEIGDFRKQMQEATRVTETLGKTVQETGKKSSAPLDETAKKAGEVRQELIKAGASAQATAKTFGLAYDKTGNLVDEFGRLVTEAKAASFGLETASDATREFAADQQYAADKARVTNTVLGQMVQSAVKHEQAWSTAGTTLLGFGAAAGVGVGLAIKSYMDFDKSMSEVRAATHASAGDMELLRTAAIKAGADTSFSATEAANAITELSKAGVSTKDILSGGLSGALSLAAAGSLGVAESAEFAASAMTQFGLSGKDIPHIADLLAAGAGKAQGEVQDMGLALSYAGVPAHAMGVTIEQTTGAIALFAKSGIIGEKAGTALRSMFVSMANPAEKTKKLMDELGISFVDSEGKFIGLAGAADVLKNKLSEKTEMERNATLAQIFGNEALGAAVSLYEAGADGLKEMTAAVNEAGYAAMTAAMKQDNLAGDIEKVGGSLDSVFLKSGSGANEVLRSLAQGADKLIDFIGQIPEPALQAGLAITGIAGGSALVAGTFLTTFPRIMETKRAFDELRQTNEKGHASLTKTAKAAAAAAAGLAVLQVAGSVGNAINGKARSFEEMANQILKASKAGDKFSATFDKDFLKNVNGGFATMEVNNLTDLFKASDQDDFNGFMNNVTKQLTGYEAQVHRATNALSQADQVLAGMAKNGDPKTAAEHFQKFAKASEEAGLSQEKLFARFPEYRDSLLEQARAVGVSLNSQELYDFAMGKVPGKLLAAQMSTEGQAKAAEFQAKANEEAAKKLEEMGLSADGAIVSLSKLLDVMFAAGLAQLSVNEASIRWQESLEAVDASIAKYGRTLDITTEAGKANQRALDSVASAGIANMQAMANNGATQEELQGKLRGTYDSLLANYDKFGITGKAAEDMARDVLGIPKDVDIDTAIQNFADSMSKLQGVGSAADALNGKSATVTILTKQLTQYEEIFGDTGKSAGLFAAQNGGATGGRVNEIMGFKDGGRVPGRRPADMRRDNILGLVNGQPIGLQGQEWIINGPASDRNDKWLRAVNNGLNLDTLFGGGYEAPSKSMAGGYGGNFAASGFGGGSSVTFSPQITVNGAADTGAIVQEIWGKFQFEAERAGLKIGR